MAVRVATACLRRGGRRSDPDNFDAGDRLIVGVLGDDWDLLDNRGGSDKRVGDRDPAATCAQRGNDAGKLTRHLGIYWRRIGTISSTGDRSAARVNRSPPSTRRSTSLTVFRKSRTDLLQTTSP